MSQENVQALPPVNFIEATKRGFKNLFNFKGRIRRSEFWWFVAPWSIILLVFLPLILVSIIENNDKMTTEEITYRQITFLIFIPILSILLLSWSSITRRLHDINIGKWLGTTPFIFLLLSIILFHVGYSIDSHALLNENVISNKTILWISRLMTILFAISILTYIINLILCCIDGKKEKNKFGDSPKYLNV